MGWGMESNSRSKEGHQDIRIARFETCPQKIHKTNMLSFVSPSKHRAPGFQSLRIVYPEQPDKRLDE